MAHKQGGGSTQNNRDSNPKNLGIKLFSNQKIKKGELILKQRGYKFKAGENVSVSKDFSLYSLINGFLEYKIPYINIKNYL